VTASALACLLSRLGFCYRAKSHRRAGRAVLEAFARQIGLGRVSMWSPNRDSQCGEPVS
jgi:hypothetical protein